MRDLFGWSPIPIKPPKKWLEVKDKRCIRPPRFITGDRISNINKYVNARVHYVEDEVDIWSPPEQTFSRSYGDCEDMVLLKRSLLLQNGFREDDIFFVVVLDAIQRRQHAILIVNDRVLDIYSDVVLKTSEVSDYTPSQAYSDNKAWVFGRKTSVRSK